MQPEEYVELAKCTEPDVKTYDAIIDRAKDPALLSETIKCLRDVAALGLVLDKYKRAIFYGKELDVGSNTSVVPTDKVDLTFTRLLHAGMGLATEAGEYIEALLEYLDGNQIDLVNLAEEVGDVCWYAAIASDTTGVPLSKIMHTNIKKLESRFGSKFNEKGALLRKLDDERKILDTMSNIEETE